MEEEFQAKAYTNLATEIGQKAVTIATLQAQSAISDRYIKELEAENKRLQEHKKELAEARDSLQKQLDELKVEGVEQ